MKFSNLVVGGGIAGFFSAYFLNAPIIEKEDIFSGASGAAGAFLFPKVGFDTLYTRFINDAIVKAVNFYEKLGIVDKRGVLILPRDKRDYEKFKKYEKEIRLPYKKIKDGFFFEIGSIINPYDLKRKIKLDVINEEVKSIKKDGNWWVVNEKYFTKNLILATGSESIVDIPYIKIRPIWGERIEIDGEWDVNENIFYHKNCSLAVANGVMKIGATHKRDCKNCKENIKEAYELIEKAKEIADIKNFEILDIKGGYRAASVDFFPIVDRVIDVDKTLKLNPKVIKGVLPKKIVYKEGLYIINGMGARGFSNGYICAKILKDLIQFNKIPKIESKRLFIKWARKEGEKYVKSRKSY